MNNNTLQIYKWSHIGKSLSWGILWFIWLCLFSIGILEVHLNDETNAPIYISLFTLIIVLALGIIVFKCYKELKALTDIRKISSKDNFFDILIDIDEKSSKELADNNQNLPSFKKMLLMLILPPTIILSCIAAFMIMRSPEITKQHKDLVRISFLEMIDAFNNNLNGTYTDDIESSAPYMVKGYITEDQKSYVQFYLDKCGQSKSMIYWVSVDCNEDVASNMSKCKKCIGDAYDAIQNINSLNSDYKEIYPISEDFEQLYLRSNGITNMDISNILMINGKQYSCKQAFKKNHFSKR